MYWNGRLKIQVLSMQEEFTVGVLSMIMRLSRGRPKEVRSFMRKAMPGRLWLGTRRQESRYRRCEK